jgi:glycine dehydrogenase
MSHLVNFPDQPYISPMTTTHEPSLSPTDTFPRRHIGPLGGGPSELADMLKAIGVASLDELVDQTVPAAIII